MDVFPDDDDLPYDLRIGLNLGRVEITIGAEDEEGDYHRLLAKPETAREIAKALLRYAMLLDGDFKAAMP